MCPLGCVRNVANFNVTRRRVSETKETSDILPESDNCLLLVRFETLIVLDAAFQWPLGPTLICITFYICELKNEMLHCNVGGCCVTAQGNE